MLWEKEEKKENTTAGLIIGIIIGIFIGYMIAKTNENHNWCEMFEEGDERRIQCEVLYEDAMEKLDLQRDYDY